MKKFKAMIKAAFEKWFVCIITAVAMFLGYALYDYFNRFYEMPKRVDALEQRSRIDSAFYNNIIHRDDSLDRLQTDYILFLHDVLDKNGIR